MPTCRPSRSTAAFRSSTIPPKRASRGPSALLFASPRTSWCAPGRSLAIKFPDSTRYWYVDALVGDQNIPLSPPLKIGGLAGGVYSKYEPLPSNNPVTAGDLVCSTRGDIMPYTYDKSVPLGFKAAALLKTEGDIFRGRVGFEIVLNSHFGVSSVGFYGRGELSASLTGSDTMVGNQLAKNLRNVVASSPAVDKVVSTADQIRKKGKIVDDSPGPAPAGNIAFWFGMLWDLDNNILHGDAEAYVNVGNVLTGTGP